MELTPYKQKCAGKLTGAYIANILFLLTTAAAFFYVFIGPGCLLAHVFPDLRTKNQWILLVPLVSLSISASLSLALILLGFWQSKVLWFFILIELIAIIYLVAKGRLRFARFFYKPKASHLLALILIQPLWDCFAFEIPRPFYAWDVVASWNRWALGWSLGQIPQPIWHYPQAIPLSWAAIYEIGGHSVEMFSKLASALIVLLGLFAAKNYTGTWVKAALVFLPFTVCFSNSIFSGLVDPLVASMGMVFLAADTDSHDQDANSRFLRLAIVATAAGLIKQAGLFLFLPFIFRMSWSQLRFKDPATLTGLCFIALLLFMYGFMEIEIHAPGGASELKYVTSGIYGDNSRIQVFLKALAKFQEPKSALLGAGLLLPLVFLRKKSLKTLRSYYSFLVIPFFMIWAFFFSYDLRNVSLVCLIAPALVVKEVKFPTWNFAKKLENWSGFNVLPVLLLLFTTGLAYFGLSPVNWKERLVQQESMDKVRLLGDEEINKVLVGLSDVDHVLSDDQLIRALPGFANKLELNYFQNLEEVQAGIRAASVNYVLFPKENHCTTCLEYVTSLPDFSLNAETQHYLLFKRKRP